VPAPGLHEVAVAHEHAVAVDDVRETLDALRAETDLLGRPRLPLLVGKRPLGGGANADRIGG
jgi:hypothetical protein